MTPCLPIHAEVPRHDAKPQDPLTRASKARTQTFPRPAFLDARLPQQVDARPARIGAASLVRVLA